MTFWAENAVGKIPGRCQLNSEKCGNKHNFSQQFRFQWRVFICSLSNAPPWMWLSCMNGNGLFDASGSLPLCCTSGVAFCRVCEWQAFLVCFPPLRDPTETIPTILPCSRQCWRRIKMEARAAKRTQVCGWSDGKPNACFLATAGPAPQNFWMLCECGKFPQCLSRRYGSFSQIQKADSNCRLSSAKSTNVTRHHNHRLRAHIHHELTTPGW